MQDYMLLSVLTRGGSKVWGKRVRRTLHIKNISQILKMYGKAIVIFLERHNRFFLVGYVSHALA
jgi:hypothetical protein